MSNDHLNRLWLLIRRPRPPEERVTLAAGVTLSARDLHGQLLLIGTPDETRASAAHLLAACEPYAMPAFTLVAPGDANAALPGSGTASHPVADPEDTDRALQTLMTWSRSQRDVYAPHLWPFLLLVSPDVPGDALDRVLDHAAALQGHNFAVIACVQPSQVRPAMRARFGNVVYWASGVQAARTLRTATSAAPPDGQAVLVTPRGAHLLNWSPSSPAARG